MIEKIIENEWKNKDKIIFYLNYMNEYETI